MVIQRKLIMLSAMIENKIRNTNLDWMNTLFRFIEKVGILLTSKPLIKMM
jgi:hypothetical protein